MTDHVSTGGIGVDDDGRAVVAASIPRILEIPKILFQNL
jgi:hypothetical protein